MRIAQPFANINAAGAAHHMHKRIGRFSQRSTALHKKDALAANQLPQASPAIRYSDIHTEVGRAVHFSAHTKMYPTAGGDHCSVVCFPRDAKQCSAPYLLIPFTYIFTRMLFYI